MAFDAIIGNNKIKELLNEIISSGKFLHSYLFVGKNGIGKMLFAKEFAMEILGATRAQIEENNHPDFNVISPEGNSIKIEQIRILQSKILEKPINSNYKVYIIDNSETMTTEAQNCLLKTLEEPPEYGIIILICSNENLLLNTIKSRCTKIVFQPIPKEELKRYIEENELFSDVKNSILELTGGSIGKAYELKEKQGMYEEIRPLFDNLDKMDKIDALKKAEFIYKEKDNIEDLLEYANILLFEKTMKDVKFLNTIKLVENAKNKLRQNANFDMTIDDLILHLWEEINENYNRS